MFGSSPLALNQRWRDRQDRYRPAGEVIDPSRFEVAPIADDTTSKAFVIQHHYSASHPSSRERVGLYESGELVGVAVFSTPSQASVLTNVFPGDVLDSVELGRFVLLDRVPGNGETWFLARCFELLRKKGYRGVVSFSDPHQRTNTDGAIVFGGHIGTIYQAHNAVYLGQQDKHTERLFPNGEVFAARTIQKIRKGERGWRPAAARLEALGAPTAPDADAARRAWLRTWLPQLTRTTRNPGKHKYAWGLSRHDARRLPSSLAYPRKEAA